MCPVVGDQCQRSSLSFALEPEGSFREGTLVVYIGGEIFGNGGSPGCSSEVVVSIHTHGSQE